MAEYHIPVLQGEVIKYINLSNGKTIVDCTLGGGGHAQALLEKSQPQNPNLKIIGIDQDVDALEEARKNLAQYDNIEFIHANFSEISKVITVPVDGFLFDLGVSSHQIDEVSRGFSIREDGPLDMRMDKNQKLTAYDVVNGYSKEELARIFFEYGEERFAKRVSNAIWGMRGAGGIKTTFQLKEIIEKAIPTWKKRESVTRIFQAIRIEVNDELRSLAKALESAVLKLKPQGRIVVISYHSLEDRIVKRFFKAKEKDGILKILTKKPVVPGIGEIEANRRAKSAKLRCAEKI